MHLDWCCLVINQFCISRNRHSHVYTRFIQIDFVEREREGERTDRQMRVKANNNETTIFRNVNSWIQCEM